jgi:hypothetical protein
MDAVTKGIRLQQRMIGLGLGNRDIVAMLEKKGIKRTESAVCKALKGERVELLNRIHDLILDEERKRGKVTKQAV